MADCGIPIYLSAAWKGVPFFCDSSNDEFGRRGDVYEYPLSDDVGFKDLGRRARRFKVEGYLIGSDQVELTQAMASAAEDPEPGTLDHPVYGSQLVSCVTLTTSADYRRDKKRTKLSFEFVEASPSMSPFQVGTGTISTIFNLGSDAVAMSYQNAPWTANAYDSAFASDISTQLGSLIAPATDERSFDAIDYLNRGANSQYLFGVAPAAVNRVGTTATSSGTLRQTLLYPTYASVADPIDYGSATVRRIHTDALRRLRDFNAYVVNRSEQLASYTPSVRALVITSRLILIRDYAVAAAEKTYDTVRAALDDLDFIMAVYDEEETAAVAQCDDVLTAAIRTARAAAASTILARNIRRPGIAEFHVEGQWPSLVVSQKVYGTGRLCEQIENYNGLMNPFWMGRDVIAPAGE